MEAKSDMDDVGISNEQYFVIILGAYEEGIGTDLRRQIVSALKDLRITADVGVYAPIYSHDIGLKIFGNNISIGLVRISGVKLNDTDIITKLKSKSVDLLTLPEDVFGTTQVMVKEENISETPGIKGEMKHLSKTLGIKMASFENKLWFVGDSIPIAVARCHLNNLHQKEFEKKLSIGPDEYDSQKLPEIRYDHCSKESTAEATFPTAYLFLYFITSDIRHKDVAMTAVVAEKCWDTRLLLHGKRSSVYGKSPVDKALDHIKDKIDSLQKSHGCVYITDHLPTGYRTMMENVLEKVHIPKLYLKSKWSHWSCYLYPFGKAKVAQQFLDEYREVNNVTSTGSWWTSLPSKMKTTVKPVQVMEEEVTDESHTANSAEVQICDTGKEEIKRVHSSASTPSEQPKSEKEFSVGYPKPNDKNETSTKKRKPQTGEKPQKKEESIGPDISFDDIMYIFCYHRKEMQEILSKSDSKIGIQKNKIVVGAAVKEQVMQAKLDLSKLSENKFTKHLTQVPKFDSMGDGQIILGLEKGSVSATGPKGIVEEFHNLLQLTTRVMAEDVENQAQSEETSSSMIGQMDPRQDAARKGSDHASGAGRQRKMLKTTQKTSGLDGLTTYISQSKNITVKVGKTNITELQVDAIVNAANKNLDHIGGVARYIAEAAGPGFDEECQEALERRGVLKTGDVCVTGAGQMQAKRVLHAVGPAIDNYDNHEEAYDDLKKTFSNVLKTAQKEGCTSVAMPAISSGSYGIPQEVVAARACGALRKFLQSRNTAPVNMILLVDTNQHMIEYFLAEMDKLAHENIIMRQ